MGQSNLLSFCHKQYDTPLIQTLSFTLSHRNSYQFKHEIGPYLNQTESDHYQQRESNTILLNTNFHYFDLETQLIQKYNHCIFPQDKSLKTYYIYSKQHYINLIRQGSPSKLK
ncbi:unnamed protein product [Paramecium sonneborni]|uniref:Uncharacterized protein n=1 Tax=Paramecium sonneborni TaxID=65129 RepID=A0A8S1NBV9_9CILI|nr:unnamed protein product [Paramecium sonneborni]